MAVETLPSGQRLAVVAEVLYLTNLLIAPGIAFLLSAWLWKKWHIAASPLARCHLKQTFFVSLYGGLSLLVLTLIFLIMGGLAWKWTWVLVIIYFTCIHSTLVVFGILGLAKAMAGQEYVYPLIGRYLK